MPHNALSRSTDIAHNRNGSPRSAGAGCVVIAWLLTGGLGCWTSQEKPGGFDMSRDAGSHTAAEPTARDAGSGPSEGVAEQDSGATGSGVLCEPVTASFGRIVPTVQFVMDASSSIEEAFPGDRCSSRMMCLKSALREAHAQMDDLVRLGWIAFDAGSDGTDETCPRLIYVDPAIFPSLVTGSGSPLFLLSPPSTDIRPTAEALALAIDDADECPSCTSGPRHFVLVTSGDPQRCESGEPAFEDTEMQARRAHANGIALHVLTLTDDADSSHLQRLANAGAGLAPNATPPAPYFAPDNASELHDMITSLVKDTIGCDLELQSGTLQGDLAQSEVTLNTERIEYQDPDGWKRLDPTHIRLQGEACRTWRTQPHSIVNGRFLVPCAGSRRE